MKSEGALVEVMNSSILRSEGVDSRGKREILHSTVACCCIGVSEYDDAAATSLGPPIHDSGASMWLSACCGLRKTCDFESKFEIEAEVGSVLHGRMFLQRLSKRDQSRLKATPFLWYFGMCCSCSC